MFYSAESIAAVLERVGCKCVRRVCAVRCLVNTVWCQFILMHSAQYQPAIPLGVSWTPCLLNGHPVLFVKHMQMYWKLNIWTPSFSKNNKSGHPIFKSWLIHCVGDVDILVGCERDGWIHPSYYWHCLRYPFTLFTATGSLFLYVNSSGPNFIELISRKNAYQKDLLSRFIRLPAKLSYEVYAFWLVVCFIQLSKIICLANILYLAAL